MKNRIGFIIDLDGTMYRGQEMVEHADEFVAELIRRGIPHLFLTNNSSRTPQAVAEHLRNLGIPAEAGNVYTAAQAAARYISREKSGARVYVIGENGLLEAVNEAGLEVVEDKPDYVVQGIDRSFSYAKLAEAVRHIRSGAVYIQTNPDVLLPSDGGFMPGAGSIGAAIQTAAGRPPIVIGKPSAIIMRDAIELLGLAPDQVWVIGDNVLTDIKAGEAAGCRTALVLTGLATRANLAEALEAAGVVPDLVCDDLPGLLKRLLAHTA